MIASEVNFFQTGVFGSYTKRLLDASFHFNMNESNNNCHAVRNTIIPFLFTLKKVKDTIIIQYNVDNCYGAN